jgi:hypothetical protein
VLGQDRMGRAPIHGWSLPCTTLVGCAQAGWYIGGVSREMLGVVKSAHRFFRLKAQPPPPGPHVNHRSSSSRKRLGLSDRQHWRRWQNDSSPCVHRLLVLQARLHRRHTFSRKKFNLDLVRPPPRPPRPPRAPRAGTDHTLDLCNSTHSPLIHQPVSPQYWSLKRDPGIVSGTHPQSRASVCV